MMMMIHSQMHHQMMLPHHDQDLLSCTNLFQYGIMVFIPDLFAFNLSVPELGPNTGEKFFSEYNTMQIQRNASIEPHPETARCMCHLCTVLQARRALLRNPYTGTTLNAAQSKEVGVAMLPAKLAKNANDRGGRKLTLRVIQLCNQFFQARERSC
jgi:hypothetical protein